MPFVSVNPADLRTLARYDSLGDEAVAARLDLAGSAWPSWADLEVERRGTYLGRLASVLAARRDQLARLATAEMGKPLVQARAEVDRCVHALGVLARHGPAWLAPEPRDSSLGPAFVRFDPLGVVLGVMPWNFPYWQIIRFAAPAVLAGNAALVKPAPNTAGCALELERATVDAGWPGGLWQTLLVEVDRLPVVVAHPAVAAVSLTGSVEAGRSLASLAASHLKPAVLELGGSDALVVLDDADVATAAEVAAQSRCINSGQSCIAAKRFIATASVYERFRDRLVEAMGRLRVGDPADEHTDIGPLARLDLRDRLLELVARSEGDVRRLWPAVVRPPRTDGAFVEPMVLELLPGRRPPVWTSEVFGPVAVLARASDAEHAFALAGESEFGLGCSVWTATPLRWQAQMRRLRVGTVVFNAMVRSTPELPFGGVGWSGYGRELGREGVRAFTNVKTVLGLTASGSA